MYVSIRTFTKKVIESETKMVSEYRVKEIIQEWCDEAEAAASVKLWKPSYELSLYTKKPGLFIGPRGERVARFQEKLMALGIPSVQVQELSFVVKPTGGNAKKIHRNM